MSDSPRIEELKRRVQVDPASIAFAALAEEYRRAGRFDEAIATCHAGLQRHPAYLSAHVTLGRALLELERFEEARQELEHVLRAAPENLAAIRGLAEIHHRRGELPEALEQYRSALQVAKHDAELEERVNQISRQVAPQQIVAPAPANPLAGRIVEVLREPKTAPAQEPVPESEPAPRPHLELVMRHPPLPASEPEPQAESRDAAREESRAVETAAAADIVEAEPVAWPQAEEAVTAEEVVTDEPDPALGALENLLAVIIREKDALAAAPGTRR
jgi:tetratricopeptide (TPR) repeat protein